MFHLFLYSQPLESPNPSFGLQTLGSYSFVPSLAYMVGWQRPKGQVPPLFHLLCPGHLHFLQWVARLIIPFPESLFQQNTWMLFFHPNCHFSLFSCQGQGSFASSLCFSPAFLLLLEFNHSHHCSQACRQVTSLFMITTSLLSTHLLMPENFRHGHWILCYAICFHL